MASQAPGNALAVFQPGAGLPSYMSQFVDEFGGNIVPRTTVPSLMLTGKVWAISIDGNKAPLQRKNQDGDLEPLPIFKAIVLDYNKRRGRSFYEGAYDPNNTSQPMCWSDDGVAPDASLPGPFSADQLNAMTPDQLKASRKISAACANCPKAVKGSKIIEGTNKATVACAEHRMLALLPAPELGLPEAMRRPLRLKIAVTSDWDNQSPEQEQQGWLSWSKYVDWLNARGCKNTALVVTKMKFDPAAAYPKIFFSAERPLQPDELAQIGPMIKTPEVTTLLAGTWTPAGADGMPIDQQEVAQPQPAASPTLAPAAAAAPSPEYRMADGETHTREAYHASGWTDEQLIAAGKLIAVAAPAPEPEVVVAPPPPATTTVPAEVAVVVGEPAATAAPATATAAAASQPAPAEAVVIAEPQTSAPEQPAAPPPVQEAAQASAPTPVVVAPPPEPQAAAAAAAAATPSTSTELPPELDSIMAEWSA